MARTTTKKGKPRKNAKATHPPARKAAQTAASAGERSLLDEAPAAHNNKHVIVVGAGPGGLTAAMILAHRGFSVTVYEKSARVGGRNGCIEEKGYRFDIGPTFLMMKYILDEVFEEAGTTTDKQLRCTRLDTLYRLRFDDKTLDCANDNETMRKNIAAVFPGEEAGYDRLMTREAVRYRYLYPCLQKDYATLGRMANKDLFLAIPRLSLTRSMHQELGRYFKDDKLKISFTFQSKYLGMSPWECPAAFMIIPYIEHKHGLWHVRGGLSEISVAMERVAQANGVVTQVNTPVKRLLLEGRKAVGVELENGYQAHADEVVINADFGYAMSNLVPADLPSKWRKDKLPTKKWSCSTFMLYLGLDKLYDAPHHQIVFSNDYHTFVDQIFKGTLPTDLSVYVRNASISDPTLAPKGHSAVYVLVPMPNNLSGVDWDAIKHEMRDKVLRMMEDKAGMPGLAKHIVFEKVITPKDWETTFNVYKGATFNLGHNLMQMLSFRPRNRFEDIDNCWLVGGGTHPGSGLPTIYESGRITANLISSKYKVAYISKNLKAQ